MYGDTLGRFEVSSSIDPRDDEQVYEEEEGDKWTKKRVTLKMDSDMDRVGAISDTNGHCYPLATATPPPLKKKYWKWVNVIRLLYFSSRTHTH